jgi:F-type H+-transporting ATPase subunit epsilon
VHVTVISPAEARFDGEAQSVVVPAYDGQVGILPHHAPFMTLLGDGVLSIRHGAATSTLVIHGGFLQVVGDQVRVVTDRVSDVS